MRLAFFLRQVLGAWFRRPAPQPEPCREDQRRSVQAVTLEQLGVRHWSCHPHF